MIGTIIWLIGVACAIWCVMDIFKKNISTAGKVIAAIVVLLPAGWDLRSIIFTAATIWKSGSDKLRRVSETRLFFFVPGRGILQFGFKTLPLVYNPFPP